jgi:hypothetical protein
MCTVRLSMQPAGRLGSAQCTAGSTYEDQQKIVDMTTSSTNSFLDAWSTLVDKNRACQTLTD